MWCRNNRRGGNNYEHFDFHAEAYNNQGHSNICKAGKIDGDHWRKLCDLYVENVTKAPMVSRVSLVSNSDPWRVYGFTQYVSSYTLIDNLSLSGEVSVANRIRVTGTNPINFDVKILPVTAYVQDPCCPGNVTMVDLYRPGQSR